MGLAWGIAYYLTKGQVENHKKDFGLLFLGLFISSWIGAKSFFLILSAKSLAGALVQDTSFWFGGGFVFYGGLIFALVFSFIFTLIRKDWKFSDLKLLIPGLILGHAIGRLGCLLAGCCYGAPTQGIFSIHLHGTDRYPVQLYESLGLVFLFFLYKKHPQISFYLLGYSFLRFGLEFLRGDSIRGLWAGLSSSQWVSLAIIFVTVFMILINRKKIV